MAIREIDGFVPLGQAGSLSYPCTACAFFDYFATGEGRTIGLVVMHAISAEVLTHVAHREFGDYYVVGAYVGVWKGVPEGLEALDPRGALNMLDAQFTERPAYMYSAKLHFNAT